MKKELSIILNIDVIVLCSSLWLIVQDVLYPYIRSSDGTLNIMNIFVICMFILIWMIVILKICSIITRLYGGTLINNPDSYKVITLCGSTRFKEQFLETQKRLTLEGNIILTVGLFGHSGDEEVWKPGTKEMLDDMHLRKIDMADEIFVINVGGYIGESTKREIAYAESLGKKVNFLEE